MQNNAGTRVSDWHKIDTKVSGDAPEAENENPGTLAGATGAQCVETIQKSRPQNTPKRGRSAMSKWGKPAHKAIARAVGYALTLATEYGWHQLSAILMMRLTKRELVALALAVLNALDDETVYRLASVRLYGVLNGEAVQ